MPSEKNFTEKNLILGRPQCRKNGLVYVLNFVRKKKNFCSEKILISSEQNQIFLRTKFLPCPKWHEKDSWKSPGDIRTRLSIGLARHFLNI